MAVTDAAFVDATDAPDSCVMAAITQCDRETGRDDDAQGNPQGAIDSNADQIAADAHADSVISNRIKARTRYCQGTLVVYGSDDTM